jgi:hypothetical protein
MPFDLVGEVMHIDHRAFDAGVRQPVKHMVEQGFARDPHQRLRHCVGERAHAVAEAGGQNHGIARRRRIHIFLIILRMILSENRFPLFGIMRDSEPEY